MPYAEFARSTGSQTPECLEPIPVVKSPSHYELAGAHTKRQIGRSYCGKFQPCYPPYR